MAGWKRFDEELGFDPNFIPVPDEEVPDESDTNDVLAVSPIQTRGLATDPAVVAAREQRDDSIGLANLMQGLTTIGTSIASRGQVKPDSSVFDASRKFAQTRADEALKDTASNRKLVSDALKAKAAAARAKESDKWRQMNYNLDARKTKAAEQQAGIKNRDSDRLPEEDRVVVGDLAKKNASKISIAGQIEAVMGSWDDLPEDQKIARGRQLLKVLNSSEGADAVGAEEAKRLGGKLEYAMGNLFDSSRPMFGRDLPGFKEQASGTAKDLRTSVGSNNQTIDQLYSKSGVNRKQKAGVLSPQDQQAFDWAIKYPKDKRAIAIRERLGR